MTEGKGKPMKEEIDENNLYSETAARLSFEISLEIAKSTCNYADGEFIKKCLIIAAGQFCPSKVKAIEAINLSDETITRCVDLMVENVMKQIRNACSTFIAYSLAINQNVCLSGIPHIAIFIRGVNNNLQVVEELLDLIPMGDCIAAETIFYHVTETVESNNLKWDKLVSVTTNGAPMMVKDKVGFASLLNAKLSGAGSSHKIIALHSLMLAQNLCEKSYVVFNVMSTIVNIVYYIRNQEIKLQEFQALLEELDTEYESYKITQIPNYIETEWLNRGTVLEKFYKIHEIIRDFMELTKHPVPQLKNTQWLVDLAFLTDLVDHLNKLNLSLQEEGKIVVELYDSIRAFQMKIQLWIRQFQMGNAYHFPKLKAAAKTENCVKRYCSVLQILLEDFEVRFKDIRDLDTDFNIFSMPFTVNINTVPAELLLELIDVRCDRKLKTKPGSLAEFYETFSYVRFPHLRNLAARTLSMFGSTHINEKLISNARKIKSAHKIGIIGYDYIFKCSLILNSCQSVVPNINQLLKERNLQETTCVFIQDS